MATPRALVPLRVRREFVYVSKGSRAARPGVVVQTRSNAERAPDAGVGFTATKKIGGAVVRNRAKRRLREAARALVPLYGEAGADYVFIARADTPKRAWTRLLDDVKSALLRLRETPADPTSAAATETR